MKILIVGGTRYFGIPMTNDLIEKGHDTTIATRGKAIDRFGDRVSRIIFNRLDENSIITAFHGKRYDVIIDKIAYSSDDRKHLLDHVRCDKYILMSTSSVYTDIHAGTAENEFRADRYPLRWCGRADGDYAEIKRQAECALVQHYPGQRYIAVRYPVVFGRNDYTGRLNFYIEHIQNGKPMYIDDMDSRISFIHENDAGLFLSHLVGSEITGPVNGCSEGDISRREIISRIEQRTGTKALLAPDGEPAPYNGSPEAAPLDTRIAAQTGVRVSDVREMFYRTIDGMA
ncbi:MAG: NAD-dependent epimerase/dehydratase family protein [Ruminiclostridium sp.]|nr:NAD-dependent epimerase/dehydratase family protein [Ruminiclostridium sp.]